MFPSLAINNVNLIPIKQYKFVECGHLSCGSKHDYIDVSNISVTGELPFGLRTKSEKGMVKFGGNCLSLGLEYHIAYPLEEDNVGIVVLAVVLSFVK